MAAILAPFRQPMFEPLTRGLQTAKDADASDTAFGIYIASEIVHAGKGAIAVRSDDTGMVFSVDPPR